MTDSPISGSCEIYHGVSAFELINLGHECTRMHGEGASFWGGLLGQASKAC
jgi:hypothetical protein